MTWRRAAAERVVGPARSYVRHAPTRVGKPVLARRLLEPALRSRPRPFTATTVDDVRMAGTTGDMIQRYVWCFGVWEPQVTAWMRHRLAPGRTLVDVGANVGYFSLLGSRLVGPAGHVVAVEALPATFAQLQANVALNDAGNVRPLNVAATATPGPVALFGGESHNSGTTSTLPAEGLRPLGTVDGVPLADLLTPEEVATTRVVKVDVEGAEADVIRGLLPVLPDMPDDVELAVEVDPDGDGEGRGGVLDLLGDHGFHAYRIDNDYSLTSHIDHRRVQTPRRFRGPVTTRMDLVLSRTDAEALP